VTARLSPRDNEPGAYVPWWFGTGREAASGSKTVSARIGTSNLAGFSRRVAGVGGLGAKLLGSGVKPRGRWLCSCDGRELGYCLSAWAEDRATVRTD
jgi:hypothetical protein